MSVDVRMRTLHRIIAQAEKLKIYAICFRLVDNEQPPVTMCKSPRMLIAMENTEGMTICCLFDVESNKSCLCLQLDYQNLNIKDFDCSICVK